MEQSSIFKKTTQEIIEDLDQESKRQAAIAKQLIATNKTISSSMKEEDKFIVAIKLMANKEQNDDIKRLLSRWAEDKNSLVKDRTSYINNTEKILERNLLSLPN